MTNILSLIQFLEHHAPLHYQESYDNSGLIVGNPDQIITGVLISLDVTEAIIDEAIRLNANVVVAHHPIVFSGLKRFTGSNYVERVVIKAIKNNIALYAIHTNLDNVLRQGVNTKIAEKLGLTSFEALRSDPAPNLDIPKGSGLIGYLPEAMPTEQFLHHLKLSMDVNVIKYTAPVSETIHKIALCGGSGRFLLDDAIRAGADVFVSADFKYHEFFDANDQIMIADIGHFESEQFTIELINELIIKNFSTFAVHSTKIITNPIKYF